MSRERVVHTVSSMVLMGARRSSPPMALLRLFLDEPPAPPELMLPDSGADSSGSSRSLRVAALGSVVRLPVKGEESRTIIRVDHVVIVTVLVVRRA
jgi:hypothetical protein